MYGSFLPEQMGFRQSRVWKRENENRFVYPRKRSGQIMAGPAVRRDRDGNIIGAVCSMPTVDRKTVKRSKHVAPIVRDYRLEVSRRILAAGASLAEHATKEHL